MAEYETYSYGDRKYEEIVMSGTYDYSWHEIGLVRDVETGQLYFGENSGCSCNWFWDDPDLIPVASWQEWAEKAKAWAGSEGNYLDHDEAQGAYGAIERLALMDPPIPPSPSAPGE